MIKKALKLPKHWQVQLVLLGVFITLLIVVSRAYFLENENHPQHISNVEIVSDFSQIKERNQIFRTTFIGLICICIVLYTTTSYVLFLLDKERKNTQIKLEKSQCSLEEKVTERTNRLVEVNEQLNSTIIKHEEYEKALKQSEIRFKTLFDNANDAIFISDLATMTIIDVNTKATEHIGYSREELIHSPVSMIDGSEPLPNNDEIINKLTKDGSIIFEHIHRTKQGTKIPVEISSKIIEVGDVVQLLSVVRNITDRKTVERKLQVTSEQMEQRVRDRTSELARKNEELQEETKSKIETIEKNAALESRLLQAYKMEAIGNLAGGIAHDFNNVLTAIFGYSELARNQIEEDSDTHTHLTNVLAAANRAKELIGQILTFSRSKDEKYGPIQIKFVVTEVINFLRASIPSTIQIEKNIQKDLPLLKGNQTQIHQVVMNLCTNASYAMKNEGLIKIDLSTFMYDGENHKHLHELSPGDYIKLTVSDSGSGISPEIIGKIFDPFFTTKAENEGTGMGLSVVHGIVKGHGGEIIVDSRVGEGTTFELFFPIMNNSKKHVTEEKRIVPRGIGRILVVDDEEPLVTLASRMLGPLGYFVTMETDSVKALSLFTESPNEFDLIISDVTMPNMTGIDMAKKCREIRPRIPIILWSGYEAKITKKQLEELDISKVVQKPVNRMDLAVAVREALDCNLEV